MQYIPPNNDWMQALAHWNQLEEQAADRLTKEKMAQIELAREMGDRTRFEQLAGYSPQFQNPFYQTKPTVDPLMQSLANLKQIGDAQGMLAGVNDMTAGQKAQIVKGPNGKTREVIDMTAQKTPYFQDRPQWQQQQAAGQGGLDVLQALVKGGMGQSPALTSMLANMNVTPRYDNSGQLNAQGQFEASLKNSVANAPTVLKQQRDAINRFNASPNRQQQYLPEKTADEMKNHVINSFYEAAAGSQDPMEIRRYYAMAHNALSGLDTAWRRQDTDQILGGLNAWMPGRGPGGEKTEQVQVIFKDGGDPAMIAAPKNPPAGFNYNEWAQKLFKDRKVARAFPSSSGLPETTAQDAKTYYLVKQLVENASEDEGKALAEKYGYYWSKKTGLLQKLNPFSSAGTISTIPTSDSLLEKYGVKGK